MYSYKNGNYMVQIWRDGTKTRVNQEDSFIPEFAESMDVKITDKCDGGCPMCYEGCTPDGEHATISNLEWIKSIHPYTEVALNGNDLSHPMLVYILCEITKRGAFANITVNQVHFMKYWKELKWMEEVGIIHGIGISLRDPFEDEFIYRVKVFKNPVIHTIAGVLTLDQLNALADKDLNVLILGYKDRGRGISYRSNSNNYVESRIYLLKDGISCYLNRFRTVCFDNLAIEQLDIRSLVGSEDEFQKMYMGDDGDFTFYIDCVKGEFAESSISNKRYPITNSVDEMFQAIQKNKIVGDGDAE